MLQKIRTKVQSALLSARAGMTAAVQNVRAQVSSDRAEGYVDTGVKILIAVVIGALLLSLLYALFANTIFPQLSERIEELFNYSL